MEIKQLLEVMHLAERLKESTRHCVTSNGRPESVAEHSWRLSLMCYFVKDEFPTADIGKILQMAILHDMGECFIGDIPSFEKTDADRAAEAEALTAWVQSLPEPYCTELHALYAEMEALETVEAKVYKALDNLEAVVQHNESPLYTWLPLEHELQLTYGGDKVGFSPYMQALKAQLNAESIEKMQTEPTTKSQER